MSAIGTILLVPVGLWERFLAEIGASALYVQNWFLAALSIDYLGATAAASPVQHFWTLSVEEQFYFALPLLVVLAAWASRGLNQPRRGVLLAAVSVVTVGSFAYSVVFTPISSAAYFSTGTRAWEFGLGALAAFLPVLAWRRSLIAAIGLVAILASAVVFTSATPFPGTAALLPAGGAALIVWAGRDTFLAKLGAVKSVAMLGRTSYAIYLWHWPLIVLLPFATGTPLTGTQKVAIILVTLGLAWVSTKYWEDPIRFSPRLLGGRSPRTVARWSVIGMVVVLTVSGGSLVIHKYVEASERAAASAEIAAAMASECFGAAAMDPSIQPCVPPEPSVFVPSLVGLESNDDNRGDCWSTRGLSQFNLCSLGPELGYSKHLLVLGDSHSNTLIGAYQRIADERGWRIDVAGHSGCYLTTATLNAHDKSGRDACDFWRAAALDLVSSTADFDAIVVTRSSTMSIASPEGKETADAAQVNGLVEAWNSRANPDTPIIAILDNPELPSAAYRCLEQHGPQNVEACGSPRSKVLQYDLQRDAAESVSNAHLIDLTDFYCDADRCEAVIGGAVVYRPDGNHLTAAFARTLAPYLGGKIDEILTAEGAASE
ncbi:hypothetical protein ASC66_09560 [Leifsonia sp. Root4]|nr:hypothetical protein ASC66_09560 [Leifsonia sp. Root4]